MTSGSPKTKVAISADFLKAFSEVPASQQKKIREFVEKFQSNPDSPGINYETIHAAQDPNLRSVRIDQAYRGIVLKPKTGNVYVMLWVDQHDAAYEWARSRVVAIHPETGSLQILNVSASEAPVRIPPKQKGLFDVFKDKDLKQLGIPEALIPRVRAIQTEEELDSSSGDFPQEAYEALFLLAAGYSQEQVFNELHPKEQPASVDTQNFEEALRQPDSLRRFHVVEDALELAEILKSPLELWRVFLHPSQQKVVEMNASGPARVLGGAGTGKTVAAMHRARWLAQNFLTGESDRILFTTFTKNLAADIQQNLRKICTVEQLKKIDVINLDLWVSQFLKRNGYEFMIVFDGRSSEQWRSALNQAPGELLLTPAFYREEWESVIQEQGITSLSEYMKASRIGRGSRLSRAERKKLWPVFEEYRTLLTREGYKEFQDAIRDARQILMVKGDILPYKSIIVDEAQDMSSEAFRLIRQMIPISRADHRNDIFIVGDAHQRIYGRRVVLSQCGIDIRGRSRKLRLNYRTTEETRRWATRVLEGKLFDDLDAGIDEQKGYRSLLHGDAPKIFAHATFSDEVIQILNFMATLKNEGVGAENVCLVARTNELLNQYEAALKGNGVETYRIKRSIAEDRTKPGLRLATMHRVKGLEFDFVVIAGVNEGILPLETIDYEPDNDLARAESELRERSLLYVAATRAKQNVLITSHGESSSFLRQEK
jgi:superfamily I DNA/RNA helicase